mgnify:CR=1 FL=1
MIWQEFSKLWAVYTQSSYLKMNSRQGKSSWFWLNCQDESTFKDFHCSKGWSLNFITHEQNYDREVLESLIFKEKDWLKGRLIEQSKWYLLYSSSHHSPVRLHISLSLWGKSWVSRWLLWDSRLFHWCILYQFQVGITLNCTWRNLSLCFWSSSQVMQPSICNDWSLILFSPFICQVKSLILSLNETLIKVESSV